MASVLFLNSKTDSLPILHVEVTLYPRMIEEKQVQVSIKKEKRKSFLFPSRDRREGHRRSESPPLPIEDTKEEIRDKEELVEEKPIVLASLNPETV